jgi:hypothetical protein
MQYTAVESTTVNEGVLTAMCLCLRYPADEKYRWSSCASVVGVRKVTSSHFSWPPPISPLWFESRSHHNPNAAVHAGSSSQSSFVKSQDRCGEERPVLQPLRQHTISHSHSHIATLSWHCDAGERRAWISTKASFELRSF